MKALESRATGVALRCDDRGVVLKVIRDDLDLADRFVPGRPFPAGVDRGSVAKALSFLAEVQVHGAAYDWELNVDVAGRVRTLHFAAVAHKGGLVIVAAKSGSGILCLIDDLAHYSAGLIDLPAREMQRLLGLVSSGTEQNSDLYDELSKLNNELANVQRQLAKANAQLESLNQLKNQFLGMAAHDLRNPLGIILFYTEFLQDEASHLLNEEHASFLSIIRANVSFMLQLVDDLLDVQAIESGDLQLNTQPSDLVSLVERTVLLNGVLAAKKQIRLTCAVEGTVEKLLLDEGKIEQVFNNLLSNAIKFSHAGTQVNVRITWQSDWVTVSVQDEGQGIPADELNKLFDWFGRTSVRGTDGEKSSGLGLAIARKIVVQHGGEIWLESQVGKGTTAYVKLPRIGNGTQAVETENEDHV